MWRVLKWVSQISAVLLILLGALTIFEAVQLSREARHIVDFQPAPTVWLEDGTPFVIPWMFQIKLGLLLGLCSTGLGCLLLIVSRNRKDNRL